MVLFTLFHCTLGLCNFFLCLQKFTDKFVLKVCLESQKRFWTILECWDFREKLLCFGFTQNSHILYICGYYFIVLELNIIKDIRLVSSWEGGRCYGADCPLDQLLRVTQEMSNAHCRVCLGGSWMCSLRHCVTCLVLSLLLLPCSASQMPGTKWFHSPTPFGPEISTLEPSGYILNPVKPWAKLNLSSFTLWMSGITS